jgi:hypothetical protein
MTSELLWKDPQEANNFTPQDVANIAMSRGVPDVWFERIRSMADHGWTVKGSRNGDREVSPYWKVRITKNWPVRGSIACHRQDGKVVYLRHSKSKGFTVEVK